MPINPDGSYTLDETYLMPKEIFLPENTEKSRTFKGGPGSGHFGHAGRPGKHGGSLPGKTALSRTAGAPPARVTRIVASYQRALKRLRASGADVDQIFDLLNRANNRINRTLNDISLEAEHEANVLFQQAWKKVAGQGHATEIYLMNEGLRALQDMATLHTKRETYMREIVLEGLALETGSYAPTIHSNLTLDNSTIHLSEDQLDGARLILKMVPQALIDESIPNPFYGGGRGAPNELEIMVGTGGYPGTGSYISNLDSIHVSSLNTTLGDPYETRVVIAHETAHWLTARIPGALEATRAEFARRTAGEQVVELSQGISVKRDRFFDAYMGRMYSLRAYYDWGMQRYLWSESAAQRVNDGSEILSVTVENLMRSPSKLIAEDPESVKFTLSTLFGIPWASQKSAKFRTPEMPEREPPGG